MPLFFVSLGLTQYNLNYVTPVSFLYFVFFYVALYPKQGKSKSTKQVLKRIDYGGSFTLLMGVSLLHFIIAAVITYLHRSVHF